MSLGLLACACTIVIWLSSRFVRIFCIDVIDEELEEELLYDELDKDNDMSIGEVTLRQRQRVLSSTKEVRTTARRVALSKGARMRIRASMMIPGASEGVLPPDAKPVTTQEALHHLAKRVSDQ